MAGKNRKKSAKKDSEHDKRKKNGSNDVVDGSNGNANSTTVRIINAALVLITFVGIWWINARDGGGGGTDGSGDSSSSSSWGGINNIMSRKRSRSPAKAMEYAQRGMAYLRENQLQQSVEAFEMCLELDYASPQCYNSLAGVMRMQGKSLDAIDVLKRGERAVIEVHGSDDGTAQIADLSLIYQALHFMYKDIGNDEESERSIQRAAEIQPQAAYYNSWASLDLVDHERKVQLYDKSLELDPDHFPAFCSRSHSYLYLAEWEKAERDQPQLEYFQRKMIDHHRGTADSSVCLMPFHTTYMNITAEMMRETARFFASKQATVPKQDQLPPFVPSQLEPVFDPNTGKRLRKLRIGYVSSDLNQHPVGRNVLALFMNHNKKKYEVYAFCTAHREGDPITKHIQKHATEYVDVTRVQGHAALAKRIRHDYKIDVLVDLNGWTLGRRLQLFGARPSPIQVSHGLGFVGTTGAEDAFDFFITDHVASPRRYQKYYTEALVWLPQAYLPASHGFIHITSLGADYDPAKADKARLRLDNGLPPLEQGGGGGGDGNSKFVFCSFQGLHRISREAFETWMEILQQSPRSVLWMTRIGESEQTKLLARAERDFNISSDRFVFSRTMDPGNNLIRIQACDLHLDSWPYNAHSTGMDVLWAGVPLLVYLPDYADDGGDGDVLEFPKMCSRVSASLLDTMEMPYMIRPTVSSFRSEAVRLSTDPEAYETVRNDLLSKRRTTPLFDVLSYTRVHEIAYDSMFQNFIEDERRRPLPIPSYASVLQQQQQNRLKSQQQQSSSSSSSSEL